MEKVEGGARCADVFNDFLEAHRRCDGDDDGIPNYSKLSYATSDNFPRGSLFHLG
jgi:hypothetical protein